MKNLECDEAFMFYILREIDRRHPAFAQLSIDCVCLRQGAAEALEW
jgi:hypothetical protein